MMHFQWYTFSELPVDQLYSVLALRADVFITEQNCAYLDPDGKDIFALHLLGVADGQLAAYCRLFLPTDKESNIVFGRVVTARFARKKGYGKLLIPELLEYCDMHFKSRTIACSAQH